MLKILISSLSILILGSQLMASDTTKDKYNMFPEAKAGFERYIIDVPKTKNDYNHKVELLIGKNIMVDCNHASLSANIEKVALKGWGYNYYEVSNIQRGPTTMMACPEPKVEKFISVYADKKTILRYNSKLGTVIYVPKGYEVHYRIWSASEDQKIAQKR